MADRISVAVIDDSAEASDCWGKALSRSRRLSIVAWGKSCHEALRIAQRNRPKVMLIAAAIPGDGGMAALSMVSAKAPLVRTILVSASDDESLLVTALEAGASGFVLESTSPQELVHIIVSVVEGEGYAAPGLAASALARLNGPVAKPKTSTGQTMCHINGASAAALTGRESQILNLVVKGLTDKAIASRLALSERTVRHRMFNILGKLGVQSRGAAVTARRGVDGR